MDNIYILIHISYKNSLKVTAKKNYWTKKSSTEVVENKNLKAKIVHKFHRKNTLA